MRTTTALSLRRYMTQIMVVATLMAAIIYLIISTDLRPGIWNLLWMLGPPVLIGLSLNRGYAAPVMTCILVLTAWVVVSIVGVAMGGIWLPTSPAARPASGTETRCTPAP